jgi:1-acyl-sn-glycerol-3-phosphate acyltransferase
MSLPPDPRIVPPWRWPRPEELLRSVAAWLWSALIFVLAPLSAVLTLGLAAERLAAFWAPIWGRGGLRLLGIEVEIRGLHHLHNAGSCILVANHQSAVDLLVGAALAPRAPLALAKAELKWLFPFNLMWIALGQRFVDRRNPEAARRSVDGIVAALRRSPRTVILAPEGTRSRTGHLGPFKTGAFHMAVAARVPIVPVCIHFAGLRMPPGRMWAERGRCLVDVHPPVPTEDWTVDQVRAQALVLEEQYRRWLAAEAGNA